MALLETLTPAERANQLRDPQGEIDMAVTDGLNENNKLGNAMTVALPGVTAGNHILETGFGNCRTVPDVIAPAVDVRYVVDMRE